jgi:hypothetical protein
MCRSQASGGGGQWILFRGSPGVLHCHVLRMSVDDGCVRLVSKKPRAPHRHIPEDARYIIYWRFAAGDICGVSIVHPPHSSVVRYWHVSSISVPEVCSESTTEDSFDRRIYRCMTAEGEVPPYHCTARMLGFVPGEFNRLSPDTSWYLCSIDPESTCMYVFPFCVLLQRSSFSGT